MSHASVHFVIDRANLFTDHRISGLPIRANLSISEPFENILVTILLQISFLPLQSGGHRCMEWILCGVVESSCDKTTTEMVVWQF